MFSGLKPNPWFPRVWDLAGLSPKSTCWSVFFGPFFHLWLLARFAILHFFYKFKE